MIEDAMSTTPIVFILIILLFGFDSTVKFVEISIFGRLRKK